MNYNTSPKSEFVAEAKNVEAHRALVTNPVLRKGIEVALAQVNRMACDSAPPDVGSSSAAHLRCLGAHDFVATFYNLAEQTELTEKPKTMNLPGNVSQIPKRN